MARLAPIASRPKAREATLRAGPVSLRLNLRSVLIICVLSLAAFAGLVANVGYGEYPVSPVEVVRTLVGLGDDGGHAFVVNSLRLPRALVAVAVGAALGVSGVILQGLTRNDLAAPDIVGINAGASLAAVSLIVVAPAASIVYLQPAALAGAFLAAGLLYLLAWRRKGSPLRLVLVGIGLSAVAGAGATLLIAVGEIEQASVALVWLAGSVYGRGWDDFYSFTPWLLVFFPLALLLSRHLAAMNLGDNVARALGLPVEKVRGLLLLTSVGLAGTAVATAGTIGFVALMAPHIARHLVGPAYGGLIPAAAATGATIVVGADFVGRALFAPVELPAGIVTAVLGAPFFLYLLYRNRNG
ncbi:iron complex transport system permease protein [Prauserella isguenensis]|uniref:Iron complex transport system permease protein n=1 Tax=Prauserella isguenensis TaxID=1470180 RepID=A0A839S685_9PSEU|nr:iron ABC transporter permease [Prauserella isguenensis]MBB3053286.1 iron complex transport system permease protein [Prauserella isguenensis]